MILIDIYRAGKLVEIHDTDLPHLIAVLKSTPVWEHLQSPGTEVHIRNWVGTWGDGT